MDFAAVGSQLRSADVFVVGFSWFGARLLVDTRATRNDAPVVEIVEPMATAHERYAWIARRRPAFGPPKNFAFWVWPHSVSFLRSCELLTLVRETLGEWPEALDTLDDCLDILASAHTESLRTAVRGGEQWRTIWTQELN